MPRTRIKICGIKDTATAKAAAWAGADAIGLVFVPASPRAVSQVQAQAIVASLPAFVEPVALFVDASPEEIHAVCRATGIRCVQLHGRETPQFVQNLAPLCVIKSLAFSSRIIEDSQAWRRIPNVSALIWDAPPPPAGAALSGGSGQAFDWKVLKARLEQIAPSQRPDFILAGGLDPQNVAAAIHLLHPYAVDVSSGVESTRGQKDEPKIHAFCQAVRQADDAA